ncbi:MlaA family lipoprotein [Thermaurantiacus sp.]
MQLRICLLLALFLPGCAMTAEERFLRGASLERASEDRLEPLNRKIHAFNNEVDRLVIRPPAAAYRAVVPAPMRRAINNFYNHLGEPLHGVNAIAQGKPRSAFRALDRFLINSVLGGVGTIDEASRMGFDQQRHDFGQTLAVWGIPSGPFLMLPLFGPSTLRDGIGLLTEFAIDPVGHGAGAILTSTQSTMQILVRLVDERAELIERGEQIRRGAADDYATIRSAWLQLRLAELWDGNPPILDEDWDEDPDAAVPQPEPEGSLL